VVSVKELALLQIQSVRKNASEAAFAQQANSETLKANASQQLSVQQQLLPHKSAPKTKFGHDADPMDAKPVEWIQLLADQLAKNQAALVLTAIVETPQATVFSQINAQEQQFAKPTKYLASAMLIVKWTARVLPSHANKCVNQVAFALPDTPETTHTYAFQ
jgi:hypothetical protein